MKTNDSTNACPKCGAPVPAEAPQGLCPKCVLAQAVAAEPAPTATSQIPSIERLAIAFPQLQIIELIGRGGMGFVFKARQPHLDRFVALKLLPDSLAHDPQFAERFNREGRVLARLNHPNIVSIFDFGQAGGFYFLMMEYVDGVNLRQAMQAGRFSPAEALIIVPKICEALQFAHEEGILHRDIKPENILLDAKGRVKIADFGIAKLVGEEHPDVSLTATGAALGTMHYMAPEQIEKPSTVDHRADIYSLGVVFYELLTGELPLGRFGPPSAKTPVDSRVDDVVMRTLEKEREKRFQSAGEMGTTVEHLTEVGAGSFKAAPPKAPGAEPQRGPGGTMVINPSAVIPAVPKWSLKAVWGAVLVGISFVPVVILLSFVAYFAANSRNFVITRSVILIVGSLFFSLPAIAGTIIGWMGLSDVSRGEKRGAAFAIFAALFWPVILLAAFTVWLVVAPIRNFAEMVPFASLLLLLVPAGTVTFIIWAIYTAVHKATRQPTPPRRGVLKWVFAALLVSGIGFVIVPRPARTSSPTRTHIDSTRRAMGPRQVTLAPGAVAETNTTPWIRFTFTAVELREVKGVRWLAIDYLDDVHGECQKSFPWETDIPGFKAETRTTEFITDAKDSSPPVRHQRVEYRMPDLSPRDQLERLRDNLEKALKRKSFRLELRENEIPLLLFELPGVEGGSLQARIKVVPPLRNSPEQPIAFGPVLERVLPEFTAIDLHSSQTKALPSSLTNRNNTAERDIEISDWLEREGMDFAFLGRRIFHGRMQDMGTFSFEAWNNFSPTQLDASLHPIGKVVPFKMEDRPEGNFTHGFKTRDGTLGLMKITHYADNADVVKIRYKLGQGDRTESAKPAARATPAQTGPPSLLLQFRLVADEADTAAPVDVMMESRGDGTSVPLRTLRTVLLDGSAVARAGIGPETNGHSTIDIELTAEGARQFAAITAANIGRRFAIVSGGRVLSAPTIRAAISGGRLQITGGMPPAEVRRLVATLNRTATVSNPAFEARMVIDVGKNEPLPPEVAAEVGPRTNSLDWTFICLIPPEHMAQILFVRWSNGIPAISASHSAYYKVGKTPAEVDVSIDHDLNGPPVPAETSSQWSSNLGLGFTLSTYNAADPPYRKLPTPARMSVRSGHQRRIPLVEFGNAPDGENSRPDGVDLQIILQPLATPAIRTVPTEKDHGHYISGKGLAGTQQEALNAIKDLPIDP